MPNVGNGQGFEGGGSTKDGLTANQNERPEMPSGPYSKVTGSTGATLSGGNRQTPLGK